MKLDIKFDVNEVLQNIAKGFNTSVDKLYPILERQIFIDGISKLGYSALIVSVVILYWTVIIKKVKRATNNDDDILVPMIAIGILVSVGLVILSVLNLSEVPTMLFNPEYYMIEMILDKVKGE